MRCLLLVTLLLFASACDSSRIYEKNHEFDQRWWIASDQPQFEFEITDSKQPYNLYLNVRNESDYPFANLYVIYHLSDSSGQELQQKLITEFLFDKKSGKPLGQSGIGDIYNHRFLLMGNLLFPSPGLYKLRLQQFMRTDTLKGVLSVGLRAEKNIPD